MAQASVREELLALPRFCTVAQASEFLGVSRATVRRLCEDGDLVAWATESGRKRVNRDSIARLVGIV